MIRRLCTAASLLLLSACGPDQPAEMPPVQSMEPEDEILRIGSVWQARLIDKELRSEPSPVTVYSSATTSQVTFKRGTKTAVEELVLEESFKMRNGGSHLCRSGVRLTIRVAYGRSAGDPTVTLLRPAVRLNRSCDPPGFPEPAKELPESRATFVLRGDQLAAIDPPLEKRVFRSVQ